MTVDFLASRAGAEVSGTISDPWTSAPTATRTIDGVTVTGRFVEMAVSNDRTDLDGGRAPRRSRVTTTFDSLGMPVKVDDEGDLAVSGDDGAALDGPPSYTFAFCVGGTVGWIFIGASGAVCFANSDDGVGFDESFDGGPGIGGGFSSGDAGTCVQRLFPHPMVTCHREE